MDEQLERQLIVKAQNNDVNAFEQIYREYYERIFRYTAFKVGSREAAEDLCQEIFMGVFRNLRHFTFGEAKFSSWVYRIAHNKCMSYFRKLSSSKEGPELEEDMLADERTPEKWVISSEEGEKVRRVVEGLNNKQRQVIEMRFFGGASLEETAQVVGKSVGAVKLLQFRAIKKMKEVLAR